MKNKHLIPVLGLTLLSTLTPQLTSFAQGSLTPPGAPTPTMKTLAQVEPRTPISSAPFTINAPGSYYLTTNVTVSTGDAITIATNSVTLDLNGFTISSTAPSGPGHGIALSDGRRNITILNGFIQGGVTNNGSGAYNGPGFEDGVSIYGTELMNTRVVGVSVAGCRTLGIYLGNGDSTVVESCTVRTVGGVGIAASTIRGSIALDCGSTAIIGDQVSDSRGTTSGSLNGIFASIAQNCQGFSISGYGIVATNAINCYGASSNLCGLYANTAQNCTGFCTSTGTGLTVVDVATSCRGYSVSGIGIQAYIANSCRVVRGATNITFKYNMP